MVSARCNLKEPRATEDQGSLDLEGFAWQLGVPVDVPSRQAAQFAPWHHQPGPVVQALADPRTGSCSGRRVIPLLQLPT